MAYGGRNRKAEFSASGLQPLRAFAEASAGRIRRGVAFRTKEGEGAFALETHDEKKNALLKLKRKRMDAIVLNSLRDEGAGFGTDTNRVTILSSNGNSIELPLQSKSDIADKIIEAVII